MPTSILRFCVIALCSAALAACTSTQPIAYEGLASAQRMAPNEHGDSHIPLQYSAQDISWDAYKSVLLDPIEIYAGKDGQFGSTSDDDKQSLAGYMQQQFADTLKARYALVQAAGPDTLHIHVTLTGIQSNTPIMATLSKIVPIGLVLNGIKSASGSQASFTGSVSYAVDIYDGGSGQLLRAYVTKQYPLASSVLASFGSLEASKVGVHKGAEALMHQLH